MKSDLMNPTFERRMRDLLIGENGSIASGTVVFYSKSEIFLGPATAFYRSKIKPDRYCTRCRRFYTGGLHEGPIDSQKAQQILGTFVSYFSELRQSGAISWFNMHLHTLVSDLDSHQKFFPNCRFIRWNEYLGRRLYLRDLSNGCTPPEKIREIMGEEIPFECLRGEVSVRYRHDNQMVVFSINLRKNRIDIKTVLPNPSVYRIFRVPIPSELKKLAELLPDKVSFTRPVYRMGTLKTLEPLS